MQLRHLRRRAPIATDSRTRYLHILASYSHTLQLVEKGERNVIQKCVAQITQHCAINKSSTKAAFPHCSDAQQHTFKQNDSREENIKAELLMWHFILTSFDFTLFKRKVSRNLSLSFG